jgi:hypothetical protein
MYKNLSIALLIVTFGLVAIRSTGTSNNISTATIIKKVVLSNQTAVIPTTTLITPGTTGLFRISAYMTQVATAQGGATSFNLGWADDAGQQTTWTVLPPIVQQTDAVPPLSWGQNYEGGPGNTVTIEGVAGQPITFWTASSSSVGTYSLYIVVERLI